MKLDHRDPLRLAIRQARNNDDDQGEDENGNGNGDEQGVQDEKREGFWRRIFRWLK